MPEFNPNLKLKASADDMIRFLAAGRSKLKRYNEAIRKNQTNAHNDD